MISLSNIQSPISIDSFLSMSNLSFMIYFLINIHATIYIIRLLGINKNIIRHANGDVSVHSANPPQTPPIYLFDVLLLSLFI